jgi:hypothetical protein
VKDIKLFRQFSDNPWNCTKNLKWLNLNPIEKHHVIDKDDLKCADAKYLGRPVAVVMHFKLKLKEECQQNVDMKNCQCHVNYIRPTDDGNAFHPIYAINCSHLNLNQLPASLPHNTSILYVTNNKVRGRWSKKIFYETFANQKKNHFRFQIYNH